MKKKLKEKLFVHFGVISWFVQEGPPTAIIDELFPAIWEAVKETFGLSEKENWLSNTEYINLDYSPQKEEGK